MRRNKKVINSQLLINYDLFSDHNQTSNEVKPTETMRKKITTVGLMMIALGFIQVVSVAKTAKLA